MNTHIILVDDDENILTSVSMRLESEGFNVTSFTSGEEALEHLAKQRADLVILDIKMPRMDGLETLRRLREKSDVPVVFLTSKDEEIDQVVGLRMGADDYITKPFSQRLLIERIRAVLRRHETQEKTNQNTDDTNSLNLGDLTLDENRHLCSWKGSNVDLTVTEFLILQALTQRPGHIKSRDQLMDHAYGENVYVDDRTIDSHIKRLRKKFKNIDPDFNQVETLYGVGYRYKND